LSSPIKIEKLSIPEKGQFVFAMAIEELINDLKGKDFQTDNG
jgi:hypothetical protein